MTLRLSEAQDSELNKIAETRGLSKHQVIEQAIERFIATESQYARVGALVDYTLDRDAELLRRLADA